MNNTATQTLENMPSEPSLTTLTRLASDDYIRNFPDDFWSPVFGQTANRSSAYEFNFDQWQAHYQERKRVMQHFIEDWLRHGGTILESFSDDRPTADFTEAYRNGCCDTLWNLKGTRRMDIQGTISNYSRPFIDKAMTPAYLANHLASRLFAFNMRIATWLEPPSMLPANHSIVDERSMTGLCLERSFAQEKLPLVRGANRGELQSRGFGMDLVTRARPSLNAR